MGAHRGCLGAVLAFMLICAGPAEARDEACFDFASPTLDSLFQASVVHRLLIVVRTFEVDARWAAKGLSLAARRGGVETTIMRIAPAVSSHDLAVEEAGANQAQMVAIIEVVAGSEPKMSTADFRDRSGQRLALLSALQAQSGRCGSKDSDSASYSAALRRPREDPGFVVGVGLVPHRHGASLGMTARF